MSPDDLLMAELKSIVDNASKDLDEGAKSEAIEVLGMLSSAWDQDEETSNNFHLFCLTVHGKDYVDQAKNDPNATLLSREIPTDLQADAVGGKVSHLAHTDNMADLVKGISDEESMLLVAYKESPHGLLVRANYDDGSKFSVMVTPQHVATERRSASGSTIAKCYNTEQGKPEDLDTYSEQEQDVLQHLYRGLVMPYAFRQKYPEAFEAMANEIIAKWGKELGDRE